MTKQIEADSLIFADEQQEKADRMEFLRSAGQFVEQVMKLSQESPIIAPVALDMLKFSITSFKVGKELEGGFDALADKLKQAAAQPQQPKPDPAMMKVQADMQMHQSEMQMKAQADQHAAQTQMQLAQQKAQLEMQSEQHKQQVQAQEVMQQNQLEAQRAQMQIQAEQEKSQLETEIKWKIAKLQAEKDILVAQISAQSKMDVAQEQVDQMQVGEDGSITSPTSNKKSDQHMEMMNHMGNMMGVIQSAITGFQQAVDRLGTPQPRTVIRGQDGKIVGVQ